MDELELIVLKELLYFFFFGTLVQADTRYNFQFYMLVAIL